LFEVVVFFNSRIGLINSSFPIAKMNPGFFKPGPKKKKSASNSRDSNPKKGVPAAAATTTPTYPDITVR
jgi:hypothetical protein